MKTLVIISMTIVVALSACTGSKRYSKKAIALEEAGMLDQAAEYYLEALRRNPDNVDARIGMKNAGQRVMDKYCEQFYKSYAFEDYRGATYSFRKAQSYYDQVMDYNIKLDMPHHYQGYYEESQTKFLDHLYAEGKQLMNDENYTEAEKVFTELDAFEHSYADARHMKRIAQSEPIYQLATAEMKNKNYREAFYMFENVIQIDRNYKSAQSLQREALQEAQLTIAVMPFDSVSRYQSHEDKLSSYVQSSLVKSNNPFIRLIDRQNLDRIVKEQKLGMTGVIDESSAAEAGLILGAKTVLMTKVIHRNVSKSPRTKILKTGYIREVSYVRVRGTEEVREIVKYHKTSYTEYKQNCSVSVTYKYQLVSSETGQILASDVIEGHDSDAIHYATGGRDIYPDPKSPNFRGEKRELDRLFSARQKMKNPEVMESDLVKQIAKKTSDSVLAYENSRF